MIYDIPDLRALGAAIDVIRKPNVQKVNHSAEEYDLTDMIVSCYEDWL
jgi:hypothetical protein